MSYSQNAQQQAAPAQKRPKTTFSQSMNQSIQDLKWSKTYYLSYKKTNEAIYLKLAATHCANAINVLKATQASFPNTTRFYYKAKNKRFEACRFFGDIQETALRLAPSNQIKNIASDGCDF